MIKALLASMFLLALQGCAQMGPYSNVKPEQLADTSSYTILETETYAGQPNRSWADMQPNLDIIRINDKKVGDIPFATYYYKNGSPQRAMLEPGHYTVQLKYNVPGSYLMADFEFDAEPGQKIMARTRYIGLNRLIVWLEDAKTEKAIGKRVQ